MAIMLTIDYGTPVNFYHYSDDNSRNFIDFIPFGQRQDIKRYNIPGVDGNWVIRGGYRGSDLICIVRYKGTPSEIEQQWNADRNNFAVNPCSITDTILTYNRCTLKDSSARRITGDMASGQSGKIWYNVIYEFDVEEL